MKNLISWVTGVAAVFALILSIGNAVGGNQPALGGVTNFDALTLSTGPLVVTSTNTATSTVSAGCYQFYATSTLTPQKFAASTTPGVMVSQYGTCP